MGQTRKKQRHIPHLLRDLRTFRLVRAGRLPERGQAGANIAHLQRDSLCLQGGDGSFRAAAAAQ